MAHVDYAAVRQLYDEGMGRNAIARELNVSQYEVDKACKALGISWEDSAPRLAAQVRSRRAAEERAKIAESLRAVALDELETLQTWALPAHERQQRMVAVGIAVQRDLEIAAHVAEHGEHNARSLQRVHDDAAEQQFFDDLQFPLTDF